LVLADSGGSNGCSAWAWKTEIQAQLCNPFGIIATIAHYPTGASKWNPIEHRLFSEISKKSWAAEPRLRAVYCRLRMLNVGQTIGQYEIVEKLGEGGMGIVYKARDTRLHRLVALKLLRGEKVRGENQLRRFTLEAQAASALNHPNIVTIYDISSENGTQYIAMEYVRGQTLDEMIPRKGMRIAEVLKIAIQITDALSTAAAAGIVHRDLKPGNIMVSDSGLVKVLDFGLAKIVGPVSSDQTLTYDMDDQASLTLEGSIVGTIAYMSPEQAQGRMIDARSDIFSFGTVLYEMVTGRRPFRGDSNLAILSSIVREHPPRVSQLASDVPLELETIINRCLRKDPARRFQTIADARVVLLDLKEESDLGKLPSMEGLSKAKASRRSVKAWVSAVSAAAVSAAAVIALAAALWFSRSSQPVQPELRAAPFASYAGYQGYPTFSPDGIQIAFSWTGGVGDITHIFVKVLGTDTPLRLTSGNLPDTHPAFAPDGRSVAFLRALTPGLTGIYQVSPLGGHERLVAEFPSSLYQVLSWSRDGKWLVTSGLSPREPRSAILVVSADSGQIRVFSSSSSSDEFYPALSPNSRTLAFSRTLGYTEWGIFVVPLDENLRPAGSVRRLNATPGLNRESTWTADGKDVIYVNGGTSTSRLWRVSATDGRPAQQLVVAGQAVYQPAVAPTGARLAFAHDFNNANIWSISVSEGGKAGAHTEIIRSARSSYVRPNAFSSDGRRIAFESNRSGYYGIWTANADGSAATLLYGNSDLNSGSPAWSKDGRFVAYDTRKGKNVQIFLISSDGGSPRVVTGGQVDNMLPSWSRDGKWIYFDSNRTGRFEVFKCSPEGEPAVQVTHNGGWAAQESPDGKSLYYTRARGVDTPLMTMPMTGGKESQVLPSVHERWWAIAERGVWFLQRDDTEIDPGFWSMENAVSERASLRFLNFGTHRISTASAIPKTPSGGIALSPDGRTLLYTQIDHQAYEIEVIENFR
jgi:serine/threonine protein kinase/Tol biopolymer transport system component